MNETKTHDSETKQSKLAAEIHLIIEKLKKELPRSREAALAVTKLEEATHWLAADNLATQRRNEQAAKNPEDALLSQILQKAFGVSKTLADQVVAKAP